MPFRRPDADSIRTSRQLADLESRMVTAELHGGGGECNVDPERLDRIETTLDAILRELAEIKSALVLSAKTQEPQEKPKKSPRK
jgi:hypothetical protein